MIDKAPEIKYLPNDIFGTTVQQLLRDGTDVEFTVTGNSMWPLLKHGRDKVALTLCEGCDIKKGDIILFEAVPSKYLLHRVMRVSADSFESAGDFNCFRDGRFNKGCVIGRAVKITRKGKVYKTGFGLLKIFSFLWIGLFVVRKPLLKLFRFIAGIKK